MKIIKIIFLFLTIASLTISCNSDDPETTHSIVGMWKMTSSIMHTEQVRTEMGVSETYLTDNNSTDITTVRIFNDDETYTQTGGQTLNYVYTEPDNSTSEQILSVTTIGNGTWSQNEDILSLTIQGATQATDATILTLNETTLKIKIPLNSTDVFGNATIVTTSETTNTYERQF